MRAQLLPELSDMNLRRAKFFEEQLTQHTFKKHE